MCFSIFTIESARYGLGFRDSSLKPLLQIRSSEYLLYAEVLYSICTPLIKASAVCTLVRITPNYIGLEVHRWTLYFILLLSSVMAIVGVTMTLTYCHPVRAWWNPLLGTCYDFERVVRTGYAWTAVSILTDSMCAIMPYLIIRKMHLPKKTKIVVMFILGLGALASVASIGRAPYLKYYHVAVDQLCKTHQISDSRHGHGALIANHIPADWDGWILLWSNVECGIGLISVCLPSLRQLARHHLENSTEVSAHVKDRNDIQSISTGKDRGLSDAGGALTLDGDMIPLTPSERALAAPRGWNALDDQELGFCTKNDSGSTSTKHMTEETTVSVVGNRGDFRHV